MNKAEAVAMLRQLAAEIEALPNKGGWDRKLEDAFPALLGVLQLFKKLRLVVHQ